MKGFKYWLLVVMMLISSELMASNFRQFFQSESQTSSSNGLEGMTGAMVSNLGLLTGSNSYSILSTDFYNTINYGAGTYTAIATANTWATLVSLTNKSGKVFNIISPCVSDTSKKAYLQLIIDDVVYDLSIDFPASYNRIVLGATFPSPDPFNYTGGAFTHHWASGRTASFARYGTRYIVDPLSAHSLGFPYIQFKRNFTLKVLVEQKEISNACNYTALTYLLDPPFVKQ